MNPVVFVSGARRGLGKAVAYEFAKKGYDIILNDKEDKEMLETIKADIEFQYSVKVFICFGDISQESAVLEMLKYVKSEIGILDVLVNNAGIVYDMDLFERSTDIFESTMHNNVTGTYLMCKYFGEFMSQQEMVTRIINISSTPGWMNTEMNADLSDELVREETSKIYLNRFAEPEEVATLVYYLGSKENTYVNNEVIVIDGGY